MLKIIKLSDPIDEKFTISSIDWLEYFDGIEYCIPDVEVEEREKTIIVELSNGEKRKYGYVELSDIDFNENINLNCTYVKDFDARDKVIELSAKYALFDGKTCFNSTEFKGEKTSFVCSIFADGDVDFFRARFHNNEVAFNGVNFGHGNLNFIGTIFYSSNVEFFGSELGDGKKTFKGVRFKDSDVSFEEVKFGNGLVDFYEAKFGGDVNFRGAYFSKGKKSFWAATFNGNVSFYLTDFTMGDVDFNATKFQCKKVNFSGSKLAEGNFSFKRIELSCDNLMFENVVFESGKTEFISIDFDMKRFTIDGSRFDKVIFDDCIFKTHINMRIRSSNQIILSESFIHETLYINFPEKSVQGLNFDNTQILGQLYIECSVKKLIGLVYKGNNHKYWGNEKDTAARRDEKLASQFLLLKENFHNIGQYEAEDVAYVEFKRCELRNKFLGTRFKNPIIKLFLFIFRSPSFIFRKVIFDLMGGYGTRPKNVLFTIIFVWLCFAGIYKVVPNIEIMTNSNQKFNEWIEVLYYSGITFLTIGYGDIMPMNDLTSIVCVIEGFVGIFLMSYFTVSFARKLLR